MHENNWQSSSQFCFVFDKTLLLRWTLDIVYAKYGAKYGYLEVWCRSLYIVHSE